MSAYGLSGALNNLAFAIRDYEEDPYDTNRIKIEQKYGALSSEYSRAIAIIRSEHPKSFEQLKDTRDTITTLQNSLMDENRVFKKRFGIIQRIHQFVTEVQQTLEILEQKEGGNVLSGKKTFDEENSRLKQELMSLKKQSKYEAIIESANRINLPINWIVGSAQVSLMDAYVKKWLAKNGEELSKLKNKRFHELIAQMEDVLKDKKISFEQKKLSDMAGRQFRNKIIHELYVPTDKELEEVKKENDEFMNYFDSLIKNIH